MSIDEKGRVISLFDARTAARTKVIERLRSESMRRESRTSWGYFPGRNDWRFDEEPPHELAVRPSGRGIH